jgi:hypothetical protein
MVLAWGNVSAVQHKPVDMQVDVHAWAPAHIAIGYIFIMEPSKLIMHGYSAGDVGGENYKSSPLFTLIAGLLYCRVYFFSYSGHS